MSSKSRIPAAAPPTNDPGRTDPDRPVCPECRRSVETVDTREAVCPDCNLVLTTSPVSTAPRPRYDDGRSRARTGGRVTNLYADRGIGVGTPENATTDGSGTVLNAAQRRVVREKPWTKHRTSRECRVDYALGEIRRMGAAFDLPDPELERAATLYRQAHARGVIEGRSVEGFATACLLAAVRQSAIDLPVSTAELRRVTRASETQVRTARRVLEHRLDVRIPPMEPHAFLPKFASELDLPREVRRCAVALLEERASDDTREFRSISPRTLAAAAIHAACDIIAWDDRPNLSELAATSNVSRTTISQRKGCLSQYGGRWQ